MRTDPMHEATFVPVGAPETATGTAGVPQVGEGALGDPAQPKPRKPNTLRLLISHNRTQLAPWGWMAAADITAFIAHYAAPTWWQSALTAAGASALVAAGSLFHTREARLKKHIKTARTRRKVQTTVRRALVAGTGWELLASTWTPIGPHAGMQLTLLGGGLVVAAPHLWRNRRRPAEATPIAAIAAPVEDPRISKFRVRFCGMGALREARTHDQENIPGGFRFAIELSLAYNGKFRDVKNLEDDIAALYDVPMDHVSVEPPAGRSARRAVVTVLTEADAHEREEAWDGNSTYDPATGCFDLGRYADSTRSHWQLNAPFSGACGGLSVGKIGSGKTGTLHTVACEAGQARLCAACVAEQSCAECDQRRICAVWMGDPQRQPFGVWRGKADVTAWGPLSCVRMLSWAHAAVRYRADHFGRMEWTDHLGRTNYGKGWFDPTPQFPQILVVIDEWPILVSDPEIAKFAVPLIVEIANESRKVGISLVLGSQESDVDVLGDRAVREALTAYNTCVHRSDRLAKQMLGIEGNPADLAPGVPGLSYLNGIGRRSGIAQRTKSIREYLRPGEHGVDVRAIADRVAAEPITYDDSVLQAITALGYTGPGQVLDDADGWTLDRLLGVAQDASEEPVPVTPANASAHTQAPETAAVREALGQSADSDVFDLMEITGLNALNVTRALDALIADGAASQAPSGRYARCI